MNASKLVKARKLVVILLLSLVFQNVAKAQDSTGSRSSEHLSLTLPEVSRQIPAACMSREAR